MPDQPDLNAELAATADAMRRLAGDRGAFDDLLKAFRAQESEAFRSALDRLELVERCAIVCRWLRSKECVRLCLLLAGPPPRELAEIPDPAEFADVVGKVTGEDAILDRLVEIVERPDPKAYKALVEELGVQRFRHVLCHWICTVRHRLVCRIVCGEGDVGRLDLRSELRSSGEAVRKLASDPRRFRAAVAAVQRQDCPGLQRVIGGVGLSDRCFVICEFFCSWRCIPVCVLLCRSFPLASPEVPDEEIFAFAEITAKLGETPGALPRLLAAVERQDAPAFEALVKQLELHRFCIQLCHWLCFLLCRRFCFCVCPPLVGVIDTPAEASCAQPMTVSTCTVSGGGPLIGIEITGTAAGAGFDHYTLRYSWGANPPIDDAVVYPDCSRPPAATSSAIPVTGGTLGYLDVFLLPAGQTEFTIHLDVFDAAAGHVADSQSFELKTSAIEISAVAKVDAFSAEDPFHLGSSTKLVKSTIDVSPAVPETSIGGAFSVDGSAYVIGCDRIMTQFVLARFPAPPAATVPTFPDAAGGTPIIAPVSYGDTPAHPWQSGCFLNITDNTIRNGNLVAFWSTQNCTFPFLHTVDKVRGVPFFGSGGLNGRFVLLLEVRDRLLPGGAFPGTVAGTDQVVVWIDNREPVAELHSIGSVTGCGDLHLKDFPPGTKAKIKGIAWDPPIDPTAPQQRPNENFGSYSLTYLKNGQPTSFPIPALTPNTRVPVDWPALGVGASGTLAEWDVSADLDYTGPAPTPAGKLARGERCAYVVHLSVSDTTHVGDSGNHNAKGPIPYAFNVINDLP